MDSPDDALHRDVVALCAHGPRTVGSAGHAATRRYLVERLEEIGLHPYRDSTFELPYHIRGHAFANVIGVAPGNDGPAAPILIGAHYDTVPSTPGADDNAAAIAIALAVARRLVERPARRPVAIAHFDAEEPPYFHSTAMGSMRFVADQMLDVVHGSIVLDLVGHAVGVAGLEDVVAVMGGESHPLLAAAVSRRAADFLPVITLPNRIMPDLSDHYAFRVADIPFLFLTCGQWRHYHRPSDTPDRLDFGKMARLTDLLETLVRDMAAIDMVAAEWHDTTPLDTFHLQRLLGPGAAAMGLNAPRDFDGVIRRLIGMIQGA